MNSGISLHRRCVEAGSSAADQPISRRRPRATPGRMPSAGRPCARQQRHPPSKRTFPLSDRWPPPLFFLTNLDSVSSLQPLCSAFRLSHACYLPVSFFCAPFSPIRACPYLTIATTLIDCTDTALASGVVQYHSLL